VRPEHRDLLRRLAINDVGALERVLVTDLTGPTVEVDAKTAALVRLAGLVALGGASASLQWSVADALAAGATEGEVVGVMVALAPLVGVVRLSSAVTEVAAALGCELEQPATDRDRMWARTSYTSGRDSTEDPRWTISSD